MKKRLSLIQMDVHVNEVEYNYARVQELLSQALSESPDIIILPEVQVIIVQSSGVGLFNRMIEMEKEQKIY